MPQFTFTQALTANQRDFRPLASWQYRRVPGQYMAGAAVSIMVNTTGAAGTVNVQVDTGTQTIRQRSPVQAGGTAGVFPSRLNQEPLVFTAMPGDELIISIDELAGATPTVNGIVEIEPVRTR